MFLILFKFFFFLNFFSNVRHAIDIPGTRRRRMRLRFRTLVSIFHVPLFPLVTMAAFLGFRLNKSIDYVYFIIYYIYIYTRAYKKQTATLCIYDRGNDANIRFRVSS